MDTPREDNIIKVRLIENAILVNSGHGWLSFENWPTASHHLGARIEKLKAERAKAAR